MNNREDIRAIFDRITGEFLYPLLERRGFRVRGGRYVLVAGDNEYYVSARLHHKSHETAAAIFVSAGVSFPSLWKFLKKCDVFQNTNMYTAAGCGGFFTVIFPRGVYPSWSLIDESSDPVALGQEMADQFLRYVFPFLEHYSRIDRAIDYWAPSRSFEFLARAAVLARRGRIEQAFTELDQRIAEAEAEAHESQRPGDHQRIIELRRFRDFLESDNLTSAKPNK